MAYEFVIYEKKGPIGYFTLNRPEVLNALHSPCHAELGEIYDNIAADPEVWVVILTGAGSRAFSAGNDLKATAAAGRQPRAEGEAPAPQRDTGGFGGNTARFDGFTCSSSAAGLICETLDKRHGLCLSRTRTLHY